MHTAYSKIKQVTTLWLWPLMALCFISPISWAATNDGKEPIHVEADQMQYDSENKINRYTGDVVARQGSLTIRSAQIEIRQDKAGYQLGVATGTARKRAFFKQDRDAVNERIEGEANRLEYDSRTATIRLVGNATLRRYRNNELWDQTSGAVITYNDNTSFFTVEGNKNTRVTSVFIPTPKD